MCGDHTLNEETAEKIISGNNLDTIPENTTDAEFDEKIIRLAREYSNIQNKHNQGLYKDNLRVYSTANGRKFSKTPARNTLE